MQQYFSAKNGLILQPILEPTGCYTFPFPLGLAYSPRTLIHSKKQRWIRTESQADIYFQNQSNLRVLLWGKNAYHSCELNLCSRLICPTFSVDYHRFEFGVFSLWMARENALWYSKTSFSFSHILLMLEYR